MIILNSVEAATELLEKRSVNYSDRLSSTTFEMWVHAKIIRPP